MHKYLRIQTSKNDPKFEATGRPRVFFWVLQTALAAHTSSAKALFERRVPPNEFVFLHTPGRRAARDQLKKKDAGAGFRKQTFALLHIKLAFRFLCTFIFAH